MEVVAFSVDEKAETEEMVDELGLDFPVLYGLDYRTDSKIFGAAIDEEREFIHPTNFILQDGNILQSTYSSGPIGRMVAEDAIAIIEYFQDQED